MGTADRVIKSLCAVLVIVFYLPGIPSGISAIILGIVALFYLVASFTGFCPLYKLQHSSNRKRLMNFAVLTESF